MAANDSFVVKASLVVTKADGSPYFEGGHTWSGLDYAHMVAIEDMFNTAINNLLAVGKAQAGITGHGK
jgi:hypothetical protein